jgi:EmrB/QacA subfamily drug resistance transporter
MNSDPRSKNKFLVLFVCCASILMVGLDVTILNVALPSLQNEFHSSISGVQWTMDAYTIVIGSLLISSGAAADRIGRKCVFQVGLVIFTLGSLLCGVAPSLGWIIAFRVLQAIGGSMLNPVAMSIISNTFTGREERARAIGAWGGVAGLSMAAGPVLGGVLIDSVGWRAIFWINVPIGLAAVVLTWLLIPESRSQIYRKPDLTGQLLVTCFCACLVFGIIEGPEIGWGSPLIVACFVISAACFLGLIRCESVSDDPLIDLRFFSSASFSGASFIALAAYALLGGFLFLNTIYLQDVLGYSAFRAGLYILPMAGAMAVFSPASGFILGKYGPRIPLTGGAVAVVASMLMFALSKPGMSIVWLFAGYILTGIGLGAANAVLTNTAVSEMPRSQAGLAAAMISTMRQVGQALGVAVVGSVIASYSAKISMGPEFDEAWRVSCWILAWCSVAVLATALLTTGAWGRKTAEQASTLIQPETRVDRSPHGNRAD